MRYLRHHGLRATLKRLRSPAPPAAADHNQAALDYAEWISTREASTRSDPSDIDAWDHTPVISVVVPVYNPDPVWLRRCVESVQAQTYPHWQLCLADDASTDPRIAPILTGYAEQDPRIVVVLRPTNGHICAATNSALDLATGQFVALLDNDDELAPHALYEVARVINRHPDVDLIYSDEDKIDLHSTRSDPAFKPDWSPDLLLSTNYISHLGVYRRELISAIGGFRPGFEGSQDYDLVLRFTEATTPDRIKHIPQVLYHWRMVPSSTANDQSTKMYAFEAGLKAVQEAVARRGIAAEVRHGAGWGLYDVIYEVTRPELVSIIIPTRDGYDDISRALASILAKTTYTNYEIIVADNQSEDPRMEQLYAKHKAALGDRFTTLDVDIPFNFSKINNIAAEHARGTYLLFLNNDTEVISPDWLTTMVSFAQFDRVGMVGAKLFYPTDQIQHAGVVLGLGGVAGHAHHMYPRADFGYFGRLQVNVDYYAVTAACAMVKKADFDTVGGFDPKLAVAYQDVDLSIRVHDLGRDNLFAHRAELYHYESRTRGYDTTSEKEARRRREADLVYERYRDIVDADPYFNPNLSKRSGSFLINLDPVDTKEQP
jgi:GT2 family glycosyltransferase